MNADRALRWIATGSGLVALGLLLWPGHMADALLAWFAVAVCLYGITRLVEGHRETRRTIRALRQRADLVAALQIMCDAYQLGSSQMMAEGYELATVALRAYHSDPLHEGGPT
jgi:hypothetical protein